MAASEPAHFTLVASLFLWLLGLIYLTAFASLGLQVAGLIGSQGILPAAPFLTELRQRLGRQAYWRVPTLFWLNASDWALKTACAAGVLVAFALLAGLWPRVSLIVLLLLYLSLVQAGQVFLGYQWDALLIEAGFLAIFLGDSPIVVWLLRWLLFRLMFLSGAVKLLSGDITWRSLTALRYHYETQPLPTPLAWYLHQLPPQFHKLSAMLMFVIELGLPFLIFGPLPLRLVAGWGFVFLQLLILLTGNYTFFNLLALALCVSLLDDAGLGPFVAGLAAVAPLRLPAVPAPLAVGLATLIAVVSGAQLWTTLVGAVPRPVYALLSWIAPWRIINTYGLFAVMTTKRPELVVQGSKHGQIWQAYVFKYKPGALVRPPSWVAPHQPRLDWQMWFAAQAPHYLNPWFLNFVARVLLGTPEVVRLLAANPFPDRPPRYVRALVLDYHFTTFAERRAGGAWWRGEPAGAYMPVVSIGQNKSE